MSAEIDGIVKAIEKPESVLLASINYIEGPVHEKSVQARLSFSPDPDGEGGDSWCCELNYGDDEAFAQGWGPDALAAALAAAEESAYWLIRTRLDAP